MDQARIEAILGGAIKNKDLIEQAFIHSSYAAEAFGGSGEHNERLEFLGDAVLELITSEFLFNHFPKEPEGSLTNWRSILVNSNQLARVAKKLGLQNFILLSKGEARADGALKESILANTFEALVGALYLDQGYETTKGFIDRVLLTELPTILEEAKDYNPKGYFQEEAQRRLSITPTYEVLSESGPDHEKNFVMGAYLDGALVAKGIGNSKQQAQQDAAKNAILAKKW